MVPAACPTQLTIGRPVAQLLAQQLEPPGAGPGSAVSILRMNWPTVSVSRNGARFPSAFQALWGLTAIKRIASLERSLQALPGYGDSADPSRDLLQMFNGTWFAATALLGSSAVSWGRTRGLQLTADAWLRRSSCFGDLGAGRPWVQQVLVLFNDWSH